MLINEKLSLHGSRMEQNWNLAKTSSSEARTLTGVARVLHSCDNYLEVSGNKILSFLTKNVNI
jgi:hypothetical protein